MAFMYYKNRVLFFLHKKSYLMDEIKKTHFVRQSTKVNLIGVLGERIADM